MSLTPPSIFLRRYVWFSGIFFLNTFALFTGCRNKGSQNLEANIASKIERCPAASVCRIRVADFTSFDWDRAFVFYRASKNEREALLGTSDLGFQEDSRQLVFIKGKKIAFYENETSDFEAAAEREVMFSDDVERAGPLYDTFLHDAVFRVKQQPLGKNGPYYILEPIN